MVLWSEKLLLRRGKATATTGKNEFEILLSIGQTFFLIDDELMLNVLRCHLTY